MLFPLVWYRIIIIFLGPIQKQYNLWNYCDIFSVCFLRQIPIHWHVWTSRGSTLLYIYIPFYILHCFHLQKVKVHENIVFTISILQIKSLRRPWIPLKCIKKKKEIVEIVINQQVHIVTSGFCWVIFQRQLLIN